MVRQQRGQPLRVPQDQLVEVARVRVEDAHLGDAGLDDPRMGVAHVGDVVDAVEVGAAVGVVEVRALAADDVERRPVADRQRRPERAAGGSRGGRRSSVIGRSATRAAAAAGSMAASRSRSAQAGASEIVRYGSSGSSRDWWALRATLVARRSATSSATTVALGVGERQLRLEPGPDGRDDGQGIVRVERGVGRRDGELVRRRRTRPRRRGRGGPVIRVAVVVDEDVVVVRVVVDHAVAKVGQRALERGEAALPGSRAGPPGDGRPRRRRGRRSPTGRVRPPTGTGDGRPDGRSRRAPAAVRPRTRPRSTSRARERSAGGTVASGRPGSQVRSRTRSGRPGRVRAWRTAASRPSDVGTGSWHGTPAAASRAIAACWSSRKAGSSVAFEIFRTYRSSPSVATAQLRSRSLGRGRRVPCDPPALGEDRARPAS